VSWAGKRHAPLSGLQHWDDLTPAERGAAAFGLGYTEEMWNAEKDASAIVAIPEDTAPAAPAVNGGGAVGSLARAVWGVAKAAAPIAGSALSRSRHPGMMVAGHVLQSMPSVVDAMADPVVVDAIETIVYLDDSGSMRSDSGSREFFGGSLLDEGKKVLGSMGPLLSGPTRVLKFGHTPTVLAPREERPPITDLISFGWDGTSGGTYMWHMIEQDVLQRYRPGSGKLRLIVVTDGHDTMSPEHYSGLRGMDPLMSSLHDFGYDVEWHIVVLGQVSQSERYESLAAATGGSFLAVTSFDESSRETARFLDAIADSGRSDYAHARRERQKQYELDARNGKTEKFEWFKLAEPSKK